MHNIKLTMLTILSVWFGDIKYIQSIVQLPPLSISRTFSSSQTEALYLINNNPMFPSLLLSETTVLLSVSMILTIQGTLISGIIQF